MLDTPLPDPIVENLARAQATNEAMTAGFMDQARSYHNTVVTIAYAGFFGIWAFTRDVLPPTASVTVAALMGGSIVFYVLFEIINMLFLQFAMIKITRAVMAATTIPKTLDALVAYSAAHAARAEAYKKSVGRAGLSLVVAWPFFFLPSLLLGFSAALLLLWNFLAYLLPAHIQFWPA
jgi:hypothetical protein